MHLEFCVRVCRYQINKGLYFLHEHPATATSWKVQAVEALSRSPLVQSVVGDMCAFGMQASDRDGEAAVKKPTRLMINPLDILTRLSKMRMNGAGQDAQHEHAHLINGRARKAQVYPRAFGRTVCDGIAARRSRWRENVMELPLMSLSAMETIRNKKGRGDGNPREALH